MRKIGFIGMGIMGLPMAVNIVKGTGQSIFGFDVMQDKKDAFRENGGRPVDRPDEIYGTCGLVFTCLPTQPIIVETIESAIAGGKPGDIIVDLSSTAPHIVKSLYQKAQSKGISLLDSPVSGGEPGAWAGTLAIMTGGDKAAFDEVKPVLGHIGNPVYTGPSTTGSVAKLANNMLGGAHLVAMAEAYAFAAKAGLDPEILFNATRSGFNGGPLCENKIPKLLDRDFKPGGRVAVHRKDIINAEEYAKEMGVELPLTAIVLQVMNWMNDQGLADLDQIGMVRYYEEHMRTFVQRGGSQRDPGAE